jgi:precorrin-6A/cobalt-precorrin-6A reductase
VTARPHLLILGGTAEAAALAEALAGRLSVTTSLAGRTEQPAPLPGAVRIGGFGGAAGLAAWIAANAVDRVVDATHPFAATISAHAAAACAECRVPLLRLERAAWRREPGDCWIEVEDMASAATALGQLGGRAFLTIGVQELAAFAGLDEVWKLIRVITPPPTSLDLGPHQILPGRGPFTLEDERRLLRRHGITVLVTKASGGTATVAKLVAARAAGLPVIMIGRPAKPAGTSVETVAAAVAWVTAADA